MEDYWKLFTETGSIDAYLQYKSGAESNNDGEAEAQSELQC